MFKYRKPTQGISKASRIVFETLEDTISCSGEHNDHPKVYIKVPGRCNYCDIEFVKKDEKNR